MADRLTKAQRSRLMAKVKGKNTGIERTVRSSLHKNGFRFRIHASDLPGKPDIVFRSLKIAVFVDGDFWHGYRYSKWGHKLPEYWKKKIELNRRRDRLNFQRLRRRGWLVVRIWEHSLKKNLPETLNSLFDLLRQRRNIDK